MYPIFDMHADTLEKLYLLHGQDSAAVDLEAVPETMLDFSRMEKGGYRAQFFAMFLPFQATPELTPMEDFDYLHLLRSNLLRSIDRHPGQIALAKNGDDIRRNSAAGKMSAVLTIEDGCAIRGKMENLERFYHELDVRAVALTWNFENCLGFPNSPDPAVMERGLTPFGRDAVVRMQELGILVDVSHLSDGGFRDVAALSKKPFIASHSNCRALCDHPRNLTDEMLRTLAEHGGVTGLNFCARFLEEGSNHSRIEAMIRHLRHMIDVGGEDCAAIGTDLDGTGGVLEIDSADKMPLLTAAMEQAGFSPRLIEKITHRNVERVLADAMR